MQNRYQEALESRHGRVHWRMGALPSIIDKTTLDFSACTARSVHRNGLVAIILLFIPVVGWMVLAVWCQVLLQGFAREIYRPIVRMAETPEGKETIRCGEELHHLLFQRSPDADEVEWDNLVSQAKILHLEQQLLLARFRP